MSRIMKTIKLNSGHNIPIVGLGTWRAKPEEMETAMNAALEEGYRHFDTAFNYNTEESVGKVISKWIQDGKIKRDELFITTKLPNVGNRVGDVEKFLDMSLQRLGMDYVDLYLIHHPFSFWYDEHTFSPLHDEDGNVKLDQNNDIVGTWKEMEEMVKKGKIKSIGLSNFNEEQLTRIHQSSEIKPAVLQIELHAYLQQDNLVNNIRNSMNVAVTAYSPLGSPGANQHFSTKYNYKVNDFPDILGQPIVKSLAEKHGKTPGQILLRHILQKGIVVIPKSLNPERIKDNVNIFDFELDENDMTDLNRLDRGEEGRIFDFLFFKGVEKHVEYPFKQRLLSKQ